MKNNLYKTKLIERVSATFIFVFVKNVYLSNNYICNNKENDKIFINIKNSAKY